jgi:hypothetical protein
VHFGDAGMQHFHDRTGLWARLNHEDPARRASFLRRAGGIRDRSGRLTKDDPTSANYHAIRVLW